MGNCCITTSSAYEGMLRPLAKSVLFKNKPPQNKTYQACATVCSAQRCIWHIPLHRWQGSPGPEQSVSVLIVFPALCSESAAEVSAVHLCVYLLSSCLLFLHRLSENDCHSDEECHANKMRNWAKQPGSCLSVPHVFQTHDCSSLIVKLNHVKWQLVCYQTVQVNWGSWLDNCWKYLLCSGVRIQSNNTEKLINGTTHPHNAALSAKSYAWSILKYS